MMTWNEARALELRIRAERRDVAVKYSGYNGEWHLKVRDLGAGGAQVLPLSGGTSSFHLLGGGLARGQRDDRSDLVSIPKVWNWS